MLRGQTLTFSKRDVCRVQRGLDDAQDLIVLSQTPERRVMVVVPCNISLTWAIVSICHRSVRNVVVKTGVILIASAGHFFGLG